MSIKFLIVLGIIVFCIVAFVASEIKDAIVKKSYFRFLGEAVKDKDSSSQKDILKEIQKNGL